MGTEEKPMDDKTVRYIWLLLAIVAVLALGVLVHYHQLQYRQNTRYLDAGWKLDYYGRWVNPHKLKQGE